MITIILIWKVYKTSKQRAIDGTLLCYPHKLSTTYPQIVYNYTQNVDF